MIPPKGTACGCKLHSCPVRMAPPRGEASLNIHLFLYESVKDLLPANNYFLL